MQMRDVVNLCDTEVKFNCRRDIKNGREEENTKEREIKRESE